MTAGVLQNEGLNLLIRSHDWPQNNRPHGHQWFQHAHGGSIPKLRGQASICLSVFSASDYCGTSGNYGACVVIRGQGGLADEVQLDEWAPERAMDTWNRARTGPVVAPSSGLVRDPLANFPTHHEEFLWGLKSLIVERKHDLYEGICSHRLLRIVRYFRYLPLVTCLLLMHIPFIVSASGTLPSYLTLQPYLTRPYLTTLPSYLTLQP